jgi:hypothetical protein
MGLVLSGDLSKSDIGILAEAFLAHSVGQRRLLLWVDMSRCGTVSPEARRAVAEGMRDVPFRGIAFVGASFQLKLLAALVVNALSLFTRRDNPATFVQSAAEAQAWLDARRRVLDAEAR